MNNEKDFHINYQNQIKSFFNCLAGGIEVFHGIYKGGFVPLFANSFMLDFFGLSLEEYIKIKTDNLFYGFHKDDIESIINKFDQSYDKRKALSINYRIKGKDDNYVWATSFGSFVLNDDDTYEFYCITTFNDHYTQIQTDRIERYDSLIRRFESNSINQAASVFLNITQNTYNVFVDNINPAFPFNSSGTLDELIKYVYKNIVYDTFRTSFKKSFTSEFLLNNKDSDTLHYELPIKSIDDIVRWYGFSITLIVNPKTSCLEGFINVKDIDESYRRQKSMERIYSTGFVSVFNVDIDTSIMTFINAEDSLITRYGINSNYQSTVKDFIDNHLVNEFKEEAIKHFSLDNVIDKIKRRGTYSLIYPLKRQSPTDQEILAQWRFGFLLNTNKVILVTRTDQSRYTAEYTDELTGLFNIRGFEREVKRIIDYNKKREYQIVRTDFDGFKLYNDEFGFATGDAFLRAFGFKLKTKLLEKSSEIVMARLEADHFVILSPVDGVSVEEIYQTAVSIMDSNIDCFSMPIRMGVYRIYDRTIDPIIMCDRALLALKSIKGSFSKHIQFFSSDIRERVFEEQFLAQEMQDALNADQFEIWFQPQVNHSTCKLIGAEALVRWNHPDKGYIVPASFIPMFEKSGFIYELDKYVLSKTCSYLRELLDEGKTVVPISVNISRYDLLKLDFCDVISQIVSSYNIPYELIKLEITESAFSDSSGIITKVVNKLIDKGFIIAIDDFGSGYSSLSMLQSVPAHILKLDMRFFEKSEYTSRNEFIIQSIIKMAKLLKMNVIAEGVEEKEQADQLAKYGCYYIQGYYYSKPIKKEHFLQYLNDDKNVFANDSFNIHKNEKQNIKNLTKFYEDVLDKTPTSIVMVDKKTLKVVYANNDAEKRYNKVYDNRTKLRCFEFIRNQLSICKDCPIPHMTNDSYSRVINVNNQEVNSTITKSIYKGKEVYIVYQSNISSFMDKYNVTKNIIENIPGALAVFEEIGDGKFKRIFISEKAQGIFGMSVHPKKQTPLENSLAFVEQTDLPRVVKSIKKAIKEEVGFKEELRVRTDKGDYKWVEVNANPLIENGKLTYYCIFSDISANKKKDEEELILQQKRYDIYKKMIEDTSNNDNQELIERIEFDLTSNKVISSYVNENESTVYNSNVANVVLSMIAEKAFSLKDRKNVLELLSNLTSQKKYVDEGYESKSIEYLRTSKTGRIAWVRTDIKTYIDPFNHHLVSILLTFESGRKSFPEPLLARFISKEVEIISIYNLKDSIGQSYFISRNYFTIDKINGDYIDGMVNYANTRIDKDKRDIFLHAISISTVKQHLEKSETYRCSFWAKYDNVNYRKTWTFSYIDNNKDGLFLTRSDSTTSFSEEESEKRVLEEALTQIEKSKYDGLTGLLTRSVSMSRIEQLTSIKGLNYRSLIMVDLDNLKKINDTFGHIEGDKALAALSETLRRNCRNGIIGRVGGDEFIVYYNEVTSNEEMETILSNIVEQVNNIKLNNGLRLSCSIGCVIDKSKEKNFEWLYRRADRSMYIAKSKGKNGYNIYKSSDD